jgi:hypothetical protein
MATQPTTQAERLFVPAPSVNLADDLVGRLLALRPHGAGQLETLLEPRTLDCTVYELTEDGPELLGEHIIFWVRVGRQLMAVESVARWVVGRLIRSGKSYQLQPPTEAELPQIESALRQIDDQ